MPFAYLGLDFQGKAEQFDKIETSLQFLGIYKSRQILVCHFFPPT